MLIFFATNQTKHTRRQMQWEDLLGIYVDVGDLGPMSILEHDKGQRQKTIGFTSDTSTARRCFSARTKRECPTTVCRPLAANRSDVRPLKHTSMDRELHCIPKAQQQSVWWKDGQSRINGRYSGKIYQLKAHVSEELNTGTRIYCTVSLLEPLDSDDSILVVQFPTGFQRLISGDTMRQIITWIRQAHEEDETTIILLQGHSMGGAWAQMVAVELAKQEYANLSQIYVIATAPFRWTTSLEDVLLFTTQFSARSMSLLACLQISPHTFQFDYRVLDTPLALGSVRNKMLPFITIAVTQDGDMMPFPIPQHIFPVRGKPNFLENSETKELVTSIQMNMLTFQPKDALHDWGNVREFLLKYLHKTNRDVDFGFAFEENEGDEGDEEDSFFQ